jgi:hypothetical protein
MNDAKTTQAPSEPNETQNAGENAVDKVMTFDQPTWNAFMAKEKAKGKNSILKTLGLKDEKELTTFMERHKALEESAGAKQSDTEKLNELSEKYGQLTGEHAAAAQTVSELSNLNTVLKNFVSKDVWEKVEYAAYKIGKSVTDDTDFETAAADYFKANPVTPEASAVEEAEKRLRQSLPAHMAGTGKNKQTVGGADISPIGKALLGSINKERG